LNKQFLKYYTIAIFFITFVVYLNSLPNSFVYDDEFTVVNNYFIKQWKNFPALFNNRYFSLSSELTYRPLVTASYFIDYAIWKTNPLGYHLTNILLHSLNTALFFIFSLFIFNRKTPAFLSALFFSSSPVFSEAVNAIGFREDLLAFLFMLLSIIFFVGCNKKKSVFCYVLSLICYFLSLFAKEMAISFPLLIVLYDYVCKRSISENTENSGKEGNALLCGKNLKKNMVFNLKERLYKYYAGYIAIAIIYLIVRFLIIYNPLESNLSLPAKSMFVNILTMTHILAYYIKFIFLPFPPNADYVMPYLNSVFNISLFLSLLLFISLGILFFRLKSINKRFIFGILWFFLAIIPVMNIIPLVNIIAERYLYIPAAGFCIIVGEAFSHTLSKVHQTRKLKIIHRFYQKENSGKYLTHQIPSILLISLFMIIFAGNIYFTTKRNNDWKNDTSLWSKTLIISPSSVRAHNNLGVLHMKQGKLNDAIKEFETVVSLDNSHKNAHNNLGMAYYKKSLIEEAEREFALAIKIDPHHAEAHNNLGFLYDGKQHYEKAVSEFKIALQNKYDENTYHYVNNYYNNGGFIAEAIEFCNTLLKNYPYFANVHNDLGVLYTRQGNISEAIKEFTKANSIDTSNPDTHNNLGIAYYKKGNAMEAEREFKLAIKLKPNHAEAHNDLGILLNDKGRYDDAITEFKTAIAIEPEYANAHMNLGVNLLKHRNDRKAALFHLKKSIGIDPLQKQAVEITRLIEKLERYLGEQ